MGGEQFILAPNWLKHLWQLTWKCFPQTPLGMIPKGSCPEAWLPQGRLAFRVQGRKEKEHAGPRRYRSLFFLLGELLLEANGPGSWLQHTLHRVAQERRCPSSPAGPISPGSLPRSV